MNYLCISQNTNHQKLSDGAQSFACKPKDWGCANFGALMT